MIKVYPAIIHKESDSFWVEFPDLEGCYSDGDTLETAISNAQDALGLYIAGMQEEGTAIPSPSGLSEVKSNIDNQDNNSESIASYIYADPDKYHRKTKAVKKTLSIPEWLADAAEERHISLSKVLQEGLKSQLGF